ncbi:hypothetical protein [Deinococcus apachensis]|uniref:hypothetical protein n=1 Tax=Deinococcus apachensis TaxID=309886 RepID=UPI000380DF20|nr:hypothetical protein [Deinococcus apachensis]
MDLHRIEVEFKLLALKAVPEIERRALEWKAQHGDKMFADKRTLALDYIVSSYAAATAGVPGLNLTTLDDDFVRAQAAKALDWAWSQTGDLVNQTVHAPVTNDSTLPTGGLQ